MANWAWPHTPADNMARLVLADGPHAGTEVGFLPPDTAAPVQVVWTGWLLGRFTAWLYEWHGETTADRGRTDCLVYRATGRTLSPDEIPPVIADAAELWADGVDMLSDVLDIPMALMFPGL